MQKESKVIQATKAFVKNELQHAEGGHDWFHIERVYKNTLQIAAQEKVNLEIVSLGALLHDIADSKFYDGDESIGPEKASTFLKSLHLKEPVITHVKEIIKNISFKGGSIQQTFTSPELNVVQDADRLDAIGAIGIARTFNYGGFKNRKIYDPSIAPKLDMSKEEYKKGENPTINHFYEKLLLLKDRMNTKTGTKMAKQRHEFMELYLEQFYAEWEGKR
ncbi:HD domain-containing protein [Mesonia sp. MT50]|uniref:HD domain-containing protein n=1 Tax=Mesonia profundi TaxID=3070998 RepID=A0ABU1A017_9FLAO|nr:HD domain-containing protein [Mesonia profundi]MDQ7916611.1 HD domain-containing protein [Mesonia profundi]